MALKTHYVVTNIRLPEEDLLEYRLLALQESKSFPAFVRDTMRAFAMAQRAKRREGTRR